ncbi:hypothetical protein [Kibdelosporangium phytohabitans]|uniref:hypothetical protein n=1 Tax=Kibdelosporangium phytohabitans TaxID=860235 RepID=UPI0012F81471|nr:hypothetical protein [Kibdelosporangium phytohabitans]MBE1462519.1 hypothetical protein [Kibdelosporangium phytohabitans]
MTFLLAAGLLAMLRQVPGKPESKGVNLKADIAEGVRWLLNHHLLRILALTMSVANVVSAGFRCVRALREAAAWARRTRLRSPSRHLRRRWSGRDVDRSTAAARGPVRGAAHARVAQLWPVAVGILVLFGVHTMVWGVIVVTIGQRDVLSGLLGR